MIRQMANKTVSLRFVGVLLLFAAGLVSLGVWSLHRQLSSAENRAVSLVSELHSLRVEESPYQEAKQIADKYGTLKADSDWGLRDCTDGYFQGCRYEIVVQRPWVSRVLFRFPFSKWPGLRYWNGSADILIKDGKVSGYSFSAEFRTSDGQWRGVGAEETTLLGGRAVEARVSDSYRVARNDLIMTASDYPNKGYQLMASVLGQATTTERQRAWHFNLGCLTQPTGCREICDVQPDAWKDFYVGRGRFDAAKYGDRYAFCTDAALLK
jgi:hypothetical protein